MFQGRIYAYVMIVFVVLAGAASGQSVGPEDWDTQWHLDLHSGYLTGGTILRTDIDGEPVKVKTDSYWLIGGHVGAEQEYLGWEATLAGAFADMDVDFDKFADVTASGKDSSLLLTNVDALVFPFGNDLGDGRIRPFLCIGPGLVWLFSDFEQADNELMYDTNLGAGIKFLLGDNGNPVLRLDWRWHYIVGSTAGLENSMYRQELTIGIGFSF
jgi:hypothetical protein